MAKIPSQEYLDKAKKLTKTDAERLFSRMSKKIGRRLEDEDLVALEALALQLEKEDEDLKEWRNQFAKIRESYIKQIKTSKI
jgi:uncharacterized protein YpuA (DUF1002 family)